MNKQEIENKLEQAIKDRQGINDNILWLKEQLAEAEKPKLRHGDFGYSEAGDSCLALLAQRPRTMRRASSRYLYEETIHNSNFLITNCLGNIFDLLKEWSEDVGDIFLHGIRIERSCVNEVFIGRGDTHLTLVEAEEIWHKLGQKIATLKRKSKAG